MTKPPVLRGIFGGTFDPIHKGHLIPAKQAAEQLRITSVALMPCHIPPHKTKPGISAQQRREMAQLAARDEPLFYVDDRELCRNEPSYTVHTLKELKALYPDQHLCFFIGMDSMKYFDRWYQWQQILTLSHLVVCQRGDETADFNPTLQRLLDKAKTTHSEDLYKAESGRILFAKTDALPISSTEIRHRIASGSDCSEWLPDAVADFIAHHRLYQN